MSRLPPGTSPVLQPLYVDTDIDYSLDMTMFPGLDNPEHKHQPALLIGTPENVAQYESHIWPDIANSHGHHQEPVQSSMDMPVYKETAGSFRDMPVYKETAGNSCIQPAPTVMTTRDLLEELLHIIDSTKSDLLDRILDSGLQSETIQAAVSATPEDVQYSTYGVHKPVYPTHQNHYVHACTPYQDSLEAKRNVHACSHYQDSLEAKRNVHACSHYQDSLEAKRNVPLRNVCRDSNNLHSNANVYSIPDYVLNLSALSYQGQNVNSRKRFMDDGENVSRKRGCYAVNPRGYVNNVNHVNLHNYDYVNEQYNVFHENMQNINLVM